MEMMTEGAHIARHEAGRVPAAPRAGEYLTYRVGGEEYGVDIQTVQEIRSYEQPTRVPGAASFVKGVVNLRGVIVPIVDLRLRLDCAEAEYTPFTVVIVLAARERVVGVVVDSVSDVMDLPEASVMPPPELADSPASDFITGIAGVGDRMLMLVDMNRLLGTTLGEIPEVQ
ncbi:chemotaxis protein CheW [Ramlibacter sp. G-1-2-2]|uniref:Chemotaxis protein CheW n=1 Tax=Ramlibacter agri TaxID=2728837 RepID=A0A848GXT0_9BURK|nr:chemotaxis protein CheW [Ramlibacter agri]